MDIYNEFLLEGVKELNAFKLNNQKSGSTGIDESLVEPYLDQIIKLNQFVNTTASTNNPSDPLFQKMFLCGWIHKSYVTPYLLERLKMLHFNYVFSIETLCCGKSRSTIQHKYLHEHNFDYQILYSLLDSDWFDKRNSLPDPEARYHKPVIDFRNTVTPNILQLAKKFKSLYEKYSFLECVAKLNDDDWKVVQSMKKYELYYNQQSWIITESNIQQEGYYHFNDSDYCCKIKDLVANGETLSFVIENNYDPTDRNMYTVLYDLLSKKSKPSLCVLV